MLVFRSLVENTVLLCPYFPIVFAVEPRKIFIKFLVIA